MKGSDICKLCSMFKKCMKPENLHKLSSYTQCPEWVERLMVNKGNINEEK